MCVSNIEEPTIDNEKEAVPCSSLQNSAPILHQACPSTTKKCREADYADMCLSDVEDVLIENMGNGKISLHDGPQSQPKGEVVQLLSELAIAADHFDANDYCVNGCWDLEGLREDVRQQRDELQKQEAPDPDADYPVFGQRQPLKLARRR
jgi:hypothetical protein